MTKTAITYGTFDLFHIGHVRLLNHLATIADKVVVGVSTDEFNAKKGKRAIIPFENRIEIVRNLRAVAAAFPEESWEQKRSDIQKYRADIFAIGDDWAGKFDSLEDLCKVIYLPRTDGISSTEIRSILNPLKPDLISDLRNSVDVIGRILKEIGH